MNDYKIRGQAKSTSSKSSASGSNFGSHHIDEEYEYYKRLRQNKGKSHSVSSLDNGRSARRSELTKEALSKHDTYTIESKAKSSTHSLSSGSRSVVKGGKGTVLPVAKKNVLSKDAFKALIQDCIEVAKVDWNKLKKGDHVRYIRHDGSYKKGGYVGGISNKLKKGEKETGQYLWLYFSRDDAMGINRKKGASVYAIKLSEINRLWKRVEQTIEHKQITGKQNDTFQHIKYALSEIALLKEKVISMDMEMKHLKSENEALKYNLTLLVNKLTAAKSSK